VDYSNITMQIIRMLSEDSRMPVYAMSKALGISRRSVSKRLKTIERVFGVRYVPILSASRLGLGFPHTVLVKFKNEPDYDMVREILRNSLGVQLALRTKGAYDLVIFSNERSRPMYARWDRGMRNELYKEGLASWRPSEISFKRMGFLPLRTETFGLFSISEKERAMLSVLNENARIPMIQLARRLGINYKTAIYRFNELLSKKYIKGFTMVMDMPKDLTMSCFFSTYLPANDKDSASKILKRFFTSRNDNSLKSRYLMRISLIGSYDSYTLGIFETPRAARDDVANLRSMLKNVAPFSVKYAHVVGTLVGTLPINNTDPKKEYKEHIGIY